MHTTFDPKWIKKKYRLENTNYIIRSKTHNPTQVKHLQILYITEDTNVHHKPNGSNVFMVFISITILITKHMWHLLVNFKLFALLSIHRQTKPSTFSNPEITYITFLHQTPDQNWTI